MPWPLTVVLIALPVLGIVLRWRSPALPLRRSAALGRVEVGLALIGLLGLVLHCTSMFFPNLLAWIPGSAVVLDPINALGVASVIWYAVPAALLLVALRRVRPAALVVLVVTLLAVGITMYDGSPLAVHLSSVLAAAIAIVIVGTTSVSGQRNVRAS